MKPLRLVVVESKAYPDMISLRPEEAAEAISATPLRKALAAAGFKPGDVVEVTLVERKP
jgi:hypothetical protein